MIRVLCMVIEIKLNTLYELTLLRFSPGNLLTADFAQSIVFRVEKTAQQLRACGKSCEIHTQSQPNRCGENHHQIVR